MHFCDLHAVWENMSQKLKSYMKNAYPKYERMVKILNPIFSNDDATDEILLRKYMQKHKYFVAA